MTAPTIEPATAGTPGPTDREIVDRIIALGGHTFPLKAGLKKPAIKRWQRALPMTADQAMTQLGAARNLAVNLAASAWLVIDTETAAGTKAMIELGYKPWSYTAKSKAGPTLADGTPNHKLGGAHFVFKVPVHWGSAWKLPTNRLGFKVVGGDGEHDKFDVLAGVRFLVVPPSSLSIANGARYSVGEGFHDGLVDAPEWLRDTSVPCPHPALAAAHGCMVPDPPQVREAREATDLDEALDGISDSEWFAGYGHLLYPNGDEDEDGCPIYSWYSASNEKAGTSHNCAHGRMFKFWGETMPSELGFEPQSSVTHLNLRAALRGVPAAEVMLEMGVGGGGMDLTTEALGLPPLQGVDGDEAGSYAAFKANAAWCAANGRPTDAYTWEQWASRCEMVLRSHHAYQQRVRAAAEAAGEVFIDAPVTGFEQLTAQQQAVVTSPPPATGLHSITLPEAPARPVQQDPGPYPVDALPEELRDMAIETAALMSVPLALAAVPLVSTLTAACGPAHIWVRPRWEKEPGAMWFCPVAPPGSKKTPILKDAHAPMTLAKKEIDDLLGDVRRAAQMRAKAAEKAALEVESQATDEEAEALAGRPLWNKGGKDKESVSPGPASSDAPAISNLHGASWTPPAGMQSGGIDHAAEMRRKADEAADAVPPRAKLSIGDATPEKLHEILSTQAGRGYAVVSEGGRLLTAATRTGPQAMDVSFWLDARDESPLTVERIGRGEIVCEEPSLNVLMMVQPDVYTAAVTPKNGMPAPIDANGFIDRFLIAVIDKVAPDNFFHDDVEEDPRVKAAYNALIVDQFVMSYMLGGERVRFRLSPEAQLAFAPIYEYIEAVAKSGCGVRATMWDKAAGNVVRLARCFAQRDYTSLSADEEYPIDPEHIVAAWRIVYWHLCSYGYAAGNAAAVSEDELMNKARDGIRKALSTGSRTWKGAKGDPGLHGIKAGGREFVKRALQEMMAGAEPEVIVVEGRYTLTATLAAA